MSNAVNAYWVQLLRQYRKRNGVNQTVLAESLGVNQTTISRWESGSDIPGFAAQRRIRDLLRRENSSRQDAVVRARVRHAFGPASLVRSGAFFLECNRHVSEEIGMTGTDMRGWCVYGNFGQKTDDVTKRWERSGIFLGDIALTITLNVLDTGSGTPIYMETLDAPHFSADGEIWSVCEVRRIDEIRYRKALIEFGGPTLAVPFDAVSSCP